MAFATTSTASSNGKENNGNGAASRPSWKFWERQPAPKQSASQAPAPQNAAPITQSVNGRLRIVNGPDGDSMTRVEFQIKHWVKGRLRIQIPRLAHDPAYGERLHYRITATSSGFRVRVNPSSRSLVIEYDPDGHRAAEILETITICIEDAARPELAVKAAGEAAPQGADESEFEIDYVKRLALPGIGLAMGVGTLGGVFFPPC